MGGEPHGARRAVGAQCQAVVADIVRDIRAGRRPVPSRALPLVGPRCRPLAAPRHQGARAAGQQHRDGPPVVLGLAEIPLRSEEHTSELQSLMRISYAVFCLKKKTIKPNNSRAKAMKIYINND